MTWYISQDSHGHGLLVLDDLSFESFPDLEKKALVEFLNTFDQKLGKVLITTRLQPLVLAELGIDASKMRLIELGAFSKDEARKFLTMRLGRDSWTERGTSNIVKSVPYSPAALKLIAALWAESTSAYGEQSGWQRFKNQVSGSKTSNIFELALGAAVDQVASENRKAYKILCSMTVLDTQGVPLPLLYVSWKETNRRTQAVRMALRKLKSLSLIRCSSDEYQCFMDEPIRAYMHKRLLNTGALESCQHGAVEDLDAMFAVVVHTLVWQTCETLIPHIQLAITYEASDYSFKESQKALLCKLAHYLVGLSKYAQALTHYRNAEKICIDIYGEEDLRTMEVAEEVAYTLMMMDKSDKAAKIHERIEKVYIAKLPEGHWQRLLHSGAYGAVLIEQSKWQEAEIRLQQGVQGATKLYGGKNRNGMAARNGLVRLYALTGKYEKARAQCEDNLKLYRRDLPNTHPNVIRMTSTLGSALTHLGRYKEGVEKHEEAVELAEQSPDVTPQTVFDVRKNLALTLSNAGDIVAAAKQQEKLLALCPQLEPEPGDYALTAHLNLGVTLERLSRYDEAETHLKQALDLGEMLERKTREDEEKTQSEPDPASHTDAPKPLTEAPNPNSTLLRMRNCLALVYLQQGKLTEAEKQYIDLVEAQKARHPDDDAHPDVLLMQNNLGGALQRRGQYEEAIKLQTEVLEKILAKPDGAENRLAMFGRTNLAESLRLWAEKGGPNGVEMLAKAESLHRDALKQRERQLGEVWQTWISRINLGMVYQAQGKLEEARKQYVDLAKLVEAVGEANLTVIMVREKESKLQPSISSSGRSTEPGS